MPFPCPFLMGGVAPGQDLSIPSSQSVPAVRFTCLVCSCDLPPSAALEQLVEIEEQLKLGDEQLRVADAV